MSIIKAKLAQHKKKQKLSKYISKYNINKIKKHVKIQHYKAYNDLSIIKEKTLDTWMITCPKLIILYISHINIDKIINYLKDIFTFNLYKTQLYYIIICISQYNSNNYLDNLSIEDPIFIKYKILSSIFSPFIIINKYYTSNLNYFNYISTYGNDLYIKDIIIKLKLINILYSNYQYLPYSYLTLK